MFGTYELSGRVPRIRANRLAMCLSAVLVSQMSAELALASSPATTLPLPRAAVDHRGVPAKSNPDHPASSPWTVKNCTDHDTDSLRDIIQNQAQSGDTVDLSQLPVLCNATDSKITLSTGEILVTQDDLTLLGPDSATGTITISGGGVSRVFDHQGSGILALRSLVITEGLQHKLFEADGGCVYSSGSVYLWKTRVENCTVSSDGNFALGGAIKAQADVTLVLSAISGNHAIAPSGYGRAVGAGIRANTLTSKYSSISDNIAQDGVNPSRGGGAYVRGGSLVFGSTVDHNMASLGSGLYLRGAAPGASNIWDSTITSNVASQWAAVFVLGQSSSLTVANSTIAFNHSNIDDTTCGGAALALLSASGTLQSSIVANNTTDIDNTPSDLCIFGGTLSGADNLVIASNVSDPAVIKVMTDPKLGPLQFNGGRTQTRALLPGSPALGMGNNTAMRPNDQRGDGYPRTTGPMQTVDIGAFQFDTIFTDGFDTQ